MKKITSAIASAAKRLYQKAVAEPVAVRASVAAIVNVLILSGVVPAPFAEDVDRVVGAALLALGNVALLLSARNAVRPLSSEPSWGAEAASARK